GADMVFMQPGAVNAMMTGGGAEVPDPWISCSRQQAISDQFVAGPFTDDRARNVSDVVLIEAQHRTQPGLRQRLTRAGKAISVQPFEIDALFKIHLSRARRLQRPVPAMRRLQIVFVDR